MSEQGPGLQVRDTVERLRRTARSGRSATRRWRLEQLDALGRLVTEGAAAIEEGLRADLGRGAAEVFYTELFGLRQEIATARRHLDRWSQPRRITLPLPLQPGRASVLFQPLGLVGIIGPWNYPVNLVLAPLVAAIAAGNCAIVKPSELAPASAAVVAELVGRYLDSDAVAVVEGGPEASEAIIDAGVDHLFFTGSARVGRLIAARAGAALTPVTLELGGKCPVIVTADADLASAARRIAWGKFMNAGQTCIAPDYVLVANDRREALLEALATSVRAMYGPDARGHADYARIVSVAHTERLGALLADHGGLTVIGGDLDVAARYVAPTILDRPRADSLVASEEIFGPILPVIGVEDLDAAVSHIDALPPPLAIYLCSPDRDLTRHLAARTRSGAVVANATMIQFVANGLPFGGVGESGTGNYHGRYGFERLSQLRAVLERPERPDFSFAYPPYGRPGARLLRRGLSAISRPRHRARTT